MDNTTGSVGADRSKGRRYEEVSQCSICREPYDTGDEPEIPLTLPCGHTFGSMCISNWLHVPGRVNSCPACRKQLFNFMGNSDDRPVADFIPPMRNEERNQIARETDRVTETESLDGDYTFPPEDWVPIPDCIWTDLDGMISDAWRAEYVTTPNVPWQRLMATVYESLSDKFGAEIQLAREQDRLATRSLDLQRLLSGKRGTFAPHFNGLLESELADAIRAGAMHTSKLTVSVDERLQLTSWLSDESTVDWIHTEDGYHELFKAGVRALPQLWSNLCAVRETMERCPWDMIEGIDVEALFQADLSTDTTDEAPVLPRRVVFTPSDPVSNHGGIERVFHAAHESVFAVAAHRRSRESNSRAPGLIPELTNGRIDSSEPTSPRSNLEN